MPPIGHVVALLALLLSSGEALHVPGVSPVEYARGDSVEVKAVKMTSSKAQLPFEYYSVAFCRPHGDDIEYKPQTLGEVLRGDRVVGTPYRVSMVDDQTCAMLCDGGHPVTLSRPEAALFVERIHAEYFVQLLVDNLPCATPIHSVESGEEFYEPGYRLGYVDGDGAHINNHLSLRLKYNSIEDGRHRVVGCELQPRSIRAADLRGVAEAAGGGAHCQIPEATHPQPINDKSDAQRVFFTYDVVWEKVELRWASRWDIYLKMRNPQIHWFSILNSLVVIVFLSGVLTVILIRTLRRDIAQYNREDIDEEEAFEERGWKLVHGDVFRPPKHGKLFVALVGTGVQLVCDCFITLFFAMLGMLSPASRGALMTAAILCYVFTGLIGGYHAGRLYRTLRGTRWQKTAIQTATLFPGIVFATCFVVNLFVWYEHSSAAVPFTTMLALVALWLGISLPLVVVGYYFGFRKQPYEHPVRVNQIPRQVPEQAWFLHALVAPLIAGALPFGALFVELYFLMNAIWLKQFYYLFGFLFIVFVLLVVCVAIVTVVMTYFQLCGEAWGWWWRSFAHAGGVAFYVMLYCVFYFYNRLEISEFVPTLVFFAYSSLMTLACFVLCGVIGFYASYMFVCKIYSAVKID